MFKKLLSVFSLSLILSSGMVFAAFDDVDENETYNLGIHYLQELGIVEGYDDGTYGVERTVNRAEMLKILFEAAEVSEEVLEPFASENCFEDVPANEWFTKYVCYAKEEAYVVGYEGGLYFRPDQEVTVVEAIKMALLVFGLEADESEEPWYRGVVGSAADGNMVPHEVRGFNVGITRAQMADLVVRILMYQMGELDEYLESYNDGREDEVVDYDEILRREILDEYEPNLDPETSGISILWIFQSVLEEGKTFTVLLSEEGEVLDAEFDLVAETGEVAFYTYFSGNSDVDYALIQDTFSLDEEVEESEYSCLHMNDHDYSLTFPSTWGDVEMTVMRDSALWGEYFPIIEVVQSGVCAGEEEGDEEGDEEEDDNVIEISAKEPGTMQEQLDDIEAGLDIWIGADPDDDYFGTVTQEVYDGYAERLDEINQDYVDADDYQRVVEKLEYLLFMIED